MAAYQMAMDIEGRLYVATKGPQGGPQMWERAPLTGAGIPSFEPLDAFVVPIEIPEWAIDSYLMFPSEIEGLHQYS